MSGNDYTPLNDWGQELVDATYEAQKAVVDKTMQANNYSRQQTAIDLGISRGTLHKFLTRRLPMGMREYKSKREQQ